MRTVLADRMPAFKKKKKKETLLTNIEAKEKNNFESRWCSNITEQLSDVGAHFCTLHLIKHIWFFGSCSRKWAGEGFLKTSGFVCFQSRINVRGVKSLRIQVWQACKVYISKDSFNFLLFILSCNNARTMILLRLKGQKSKTDTFYDSIKGTRRQS